MKMNFYINNKRIACFVTAFLMLLNTVTFAEEPQDKADIIENNEYNAEVSAVLEQEEELPVTIEPETIVLKTEVFKASDNIKLIREFIVDKNGNYQKTYVIEFSPDGSGVMRFLGGGNLNSRNTIDKLIQIDNYNYTESLKNKSETTVVENSENTDVADVTVDNTSNFAEIKINATVEISEDNLIESKTYVENSVETEVTHILNPVAAMNADFFNIYTGVPESAVIVDGKIITSDRDNFVFAVTGDGKYFFDKPLFNFIATFNDKQYNILHFNKEFTEYGLYLYSQHYASNTRISVPSTELVLMPYTDCKTFYEFAVEYFSVSEQEFPEDFYVLETVVSQPENISGETEADETEIVKEVYETLDDEQDAVIETDEEYIETEDEVSTENIETVDENLTEQVEQTFVVNPIYKEIVYNYIAEKGYVLIGDKYYLEGSSDVKFGEKIDFVTENIRINSEGKALELPQNRLVLAAKTETQGFKLEKAFVGMDVSLEIGGNEKFSDVVQAIGCGAVIVNNGEIIDHNNPSHYNSYQPRTAIGITEDGKIIMYAVDGRSSSQSKGLKLHELSEEMIRHGCVYAVNLDGGGSTTVKMTDYVTGDFKTVNSPSDGSERKVANAIGFFNTLEKTGEPAYSYFVGNNIFVMPNSSLPIEQNIVYFDSSFYPVEAETIEENEEINITDSVEVDEVPENSQDNVNNPHEDTFTYYIDENKGIYENSLYSPMGYIGKAEIYSESGEDFRNIAFTVTSTDKVDEISFNNDVEYIYVGDSVDFDVSSKFHDFEVFGSDSEYLWELSLPNGIIDENGLFTSLASAENLVVSASFGDAKAEYPIEIRMLPFGDIENHWSKQAVCKVYENGITVGELTELGRLYFPDRYFSRNEFCVMLARLMGLTVAVDTVVEKQEEAENEDILDVEQTEENTSDTTAEIVEANENEVIEETDSLVDVLELPSEIITDSEEKYPIAKQTFFDYESIPSWSIDSIEALLEIGYLDTFHHISEDGSIIHDGSVQVTRREFMRLLGKLLGEVPEEYSVELSDITDEDEDYEAIRKVLYYGLFIGYEDKTLRPSGFLTRAEVAQVFYRLSGII